MNVVHPDVCRDHRGISRKRGNHKGGSKQNGSRWKEKNWKKVSQSADKRESDMKAVEQIKVKLSAFTYLDEHFDSDCLIISSPFFICAPLHPKVAGREETFSLCPHTSLYHYRGSSCFLYSSQLSFLIRVITIHFLSVHTSPYLLRSFSCHVLCIQSCWFTCLMYACVWVCVGVCGGVFLCVLCPCF